MQDAIIEALLSNGLLSPEQMERLLGEPADGDSPSGLEQLLDRLIDRMGQQGYLTPQPDQGTLSGGQQGKDLPPVKFEVTDKGIDFLGLSRAARPARLTGPKQRGPARHARPGHWHRRRRRGQAVRIRRHA